MLRTPGRIALLLLLASPLSAQFEYSLELDTESRTWHVEGRFANPGGREVHYWFARWTPGAYHVADFGRFVHELSATDGAGKALAVERVDDAEFVIAANGAENIVVSYEADSISSGVVSHGAVIDVESNRIRDEYAYVTPVSLFGFVAQRTQEPFSLRVRLPEGWKTGTALRQDDEGIYHAKSFERFEDSPLFFSPELHTVKTEAGGKELFVSVHGKSGNQLEQQVEDCVRIAEGAIALMGGAPYESYHFLIGYVAEGSGSGLEHSDSTLILTGAQARPESIRGLVAHEFFHLWCAERIHVEGIRKPDFTQRFETSTIWVNECMTEYMSQHVLLQAGMLSREEFFREVGPNARIDQMAARLGAPVEVSLQAASWESMRDLGAFAAKMYQHGPRIILALDMEMRRASDGERGIVDFLRHMMREYDAVGRGFPEDGVLEILEEIAGGELDDFYERYILGAGNPDLEKHLDTIGCTVRRDDGGAVEVLENPSAAQIHALDDFFSSGD